MVTHQLQVKRRTGKVRRPETDVLPLCHATNFTTIGLHKGKGSPYSITERRVPELIPVLCSQPAGGVSHKPGGSAAITFRQALQLPSRPLRGLLPVLLLGEQRHGGCEQCA